MGDLTKRELKTRVTALEEALRQAEIRATVGRLALEMIHEIRNPLDALSSLTFLARQEAHHPDKVKSYLELAEEQMANLRYISSKTLRYSQAASTFEAADLVKVAEAALRIHQNRIKQGNIRLMIDLPAQLIAPMHFGEMLQVISNLVSNALDALSEGGSLRLRVRAQRDEVHILLADSGHGIPSEDLDSIFKPFFTTKGIHGTGIGLALIEKIVKGHRGRIRVRSSMQQHRCGTTFRISIPGKL
jgi:signal transduction histidine kinase